MSVSISNRKIEINLNSYMEIVEPKVGNLLDIVDNSKEICINILNTDQMSGGIFENVLKIVNYGDHIIVTEKYHSPLGEIYVEKHYEDVKPSAILKILFPDTFK